MCAQGVELLSTVRDAGFGLPLVSSRREVGREEIENRRIIMAELFSATFQYVTIVPQGGTGASPWAMQSSCELIEFSGGRLCKARLVGRRPLLYISDVGMTPNPSTSRPAVLRSELRLVATDKEYASHESASYFFDKALLNCLRPGDAFHMVRTQDCGRSFGASAIRQGKLIFAVGEVFRVPLGSDITARIPLDLIQRARKVFQRRDSEFEFPEFPVEFRIGDSSRVIYRGQVQMSGYHLRVERALASCDGAPPACVSICLEEACDWVAASATAQLLKMA